MPVQESIHFFIGSEDNLSLYTFRYLGIVLCFSTDFLAAGKAEKTTAAKAQKNKAIAMGATEPP